MTNTIYVLAVYGGEWEDHFRAHVKASFDKELVEKWMREEEELYDKLDTQLIPYRKEGYTATEIKLKELSGGKYKSLSTFDDIDGFDIDEIPFE